VSIPFLLDQNPNVASVGLDGAGGRAARKVPHGAARSNSERAAPSAGIGRRYSAADGLSQDIANTVRALDRSRS
jgi:hypothetical protein